MTIPTQAHPRLGAVQLSLVAFLSLLVALPCSIRWIEDWYVDVNLPASGGGAHGPTGTTPPPPLPCRTDGPTGMNLLCGVMSAATVVSDGITSFLPPGSQLETSGLGDERVALWGHWVRFGKAPESMPDSHTGSRPRSVYEATAILEDGEVPAIQRHFTAVLRRLEARDLSGLAPTLRARREHLIERLSEYRERGIFPRNHALPGLAPVFTDEEGRACAVAYLMAESGSPGLAERVAAQQNNAYVPEITTPGVAQWIEESGLDMEECALIQPGYGCGMVGIGCIFGVGLPRRLDFFAYPRQGPGPLTVNFIGYYSPLYTIWSWDFGDGATSNLQNPSHTYTAPGSYTVSLTAMSLFHPSSPTKTEVGYVTVLP